MVIDPKIEQAILLAHLTDIILQKLNPSDYQHGAFDFLTLAEKIEAIHHSDEIVHSRLLTFNDAVYAHLAHQHHYSQSVHPSYVNPEETKKLEDMRRQTQDALINAIKMSAFY